MGFSYDLKEVRDFSKKGWKLIKHTKKNFFLITFKKLKILKFWTKIIIFFLKELKIFKLEKIFIMFLGIAW